MLVTTSALTLINCTDDFKEVSAPTGSTIAAVANDDADLDIFSAAIIKTGLAPSLGNNNSGAFTVFAPSDAAFVSYLKTALARDPFTEDDALTFINTEMSGTTAVTTAALSARLTYMMISSSIKSSELTGDQVFTTLSTARLSISKPGDVLLNASAKVIKNDLIASNGVLHVIDRVLSVPSVASALTTIGASVNYGITPNVVTPAVTTGGDDNGSDYDILAYALAKTEVVRLVLPNKSPLPDYTFFAPSDDAMRAAFGDTQPATLALENATMNTIKLMTVEELAAFAKRLKFHIVAGRILSSDIADGEEFTTLLGAEKKLKITGSGSMILHDFDGDDETYAIIMSANNLTNAGVIHRVNYLMKVE
jgi:uncharacterized surface protein with fasciclin (FAS1) repeats